MTAQHKQDLSELLWTVSSAQPENKFLSEKLT
jgi:hypothetical protein